MIQYISKAAVMAEIDRRIQFFTKESGNSNSDIVIVLFGLKSYLDTFDVKEVDESRYNGFLGKELQMVDNEIDRLEKLKVKEVDLEKETDKYISENFYGSETLGFFANRTKEEPNWKDIELCAKHFFELGMQVSNKALKREKV